MMKQIAVFAVFASALLASQGAYAAEQTAILAVPGMSCPSCPYIIKSAISELDGVKQVTATFESRTTTVIFDDTVTSLDAIQQATASVGFQSVILEMKDGS